MEYSLTRLQNYSKISLQDLKLQDVIEKLNMIGFEIDNVTIESFNFSEKIQIFIKVPSNREDLLIEKIFLQELSVLFLFDLYQKWEGLKQNYSFLLKQKYLQYFHYESIKIDSNLSSLLVYIFKINKKKSEINLLNLSSSPIWIQEKLLEFGICPKKNYQDLIELINCEWGQSFVTFPISSVEKNFPYNNSVRAETESTQLKKQNLSFTLEKINEEFFTQQKLLSTTSEETNNETNNFSFDLYPGTIILNQKENKSHILSILGNKKKDSLYENQNSKNQNLSLEPEFFIQGIFYDIYENPLQLNSLKTNLSYRFLRKTFLENFKFSFQRLLSLFEIIYNVSIDSKVYLKNEKTLQLKNEKIIKLNFLSFFYFLNIRKENIDFSIFEKASLKKICLTQENCYFSIPSSRNDLTREIDLIEEYCRFLGYKNIQEILPLSFDFFKKKDNENKKKNKQWIKQYFLINNFFELLTNSLDENKNLKKNSIVLKNPLSTEFSVLRTSLLPKIFEIFEFNLRTNGERKNYFEIGRVFLKEKKKIKENEKVAGLFQLERIKKTKIANQEWFLAKAFLEKFCFSFGYKKITFESLSSIELDYINLNYLKESNLIQLFHPKNTVFFKSENTYLGIFGQLNSIYEEKYSSKYTTYLFEFNLLAFPFLQLKNEIKLFSLFSKYPTIKKDLSFLIQKNMNFSAIKDELWKVSEYVKRIEFFDVYFDKSSSHNVYIGLRFIFQSMTETLTTEIVEKELIKLKTILIQQFKVEFKE